MKKKLKRWWTEPSIGGMMGGITGEEMMFVLTVPVGIYVLWCLIMLKITH